VQTEFGWHVIQVRAREEREQTDTEFEQSKNTAFDQYLTDLRAADTSNVQVFDTWADNVPSEPIFAPVL
jgi:parvulin-like peptidyl-prolyl isomerase